MDKLRSDIDEILERESIFWGQRARANWLKDGDRNTSFFHSKATQSHKKKKIDSIVDPNGIWQEDQRVVEDNFVNYFQELFSAGEGLNMGPVLQLIQARVPDHSASHLSRPFSEVELHHALFQMHPTKAPGPDGKPALFFQKFWPVVGPSVISAVLGVLNGVDEISHINHTFIVLIPKIKNPKLMSEFRPISLCNVVYKIIAKMLANRLKEVLPSVISDTQSAFIPGRLITNNALVAFEVFHFLKNKRAGKDGCMALKLDMSKAYDRVEWPFINQMMLLLGFPQRFVQLIMNCVSTVSFSVLVNGKPSSMFYPTRGIRQGDPLSPYLFTICAEGMSALLDRAMAANRLSGISICRGSPRLSHLFFADDSLLFAAAKEGEAVVLREILHKYEQESGQKVNFQKSAVCFSKNTDLVNQRVVTSILGVGSLAPYGKYLGLPYCVGHSKRAVLGFVKERV
ncbi:unnamed protein product [Camellia sinensis]